MTTPPDRPAEAPIFEGLIAEHGDVLAESRMAARATEDEAAAALDWSALEPASDGEHDCSRGRGIGRHPDSGASCHGRQWA
jgi:hypothetical protein